jgi:hypothetical protein
MLYWAFTMPCQMSLATAHNVEQQEKKIGAVVKESIQDFKEDLETQKKEIQGQLYKEDE